MPRLIREYEHLAERWAKAPLLVKQVEPFREQGAAGAFYEQRVYDIYTSMVEFAKTDPAGGHRGISAFIIELDWNGMGAETRTEFEKLFEADQAKSE